VSDGDFRKNPDATAFERPLHLLFSNEGL
jgi:hypothetical protein